MDMEKIRSLIEQLTGIMDARKLDELEIEVDDLKVALRRNPRGREAPAVVMAPHPAALPVGGPVSGTVGVAPAAAGTDENRHVVYSPMVGTFYRAQSPDSPPCVEVGDEVGPDTVLCIIEAMKVMNELKAEVEGTLVSAAAENGEAVEFGQPLFVIALRKH